MHTHKHAHRRQELGVRVHGKMHEPGVCSPSSYLEIRLSPRLGEGGSDGGRRVPGGNIAYLSSTQKLSGTMTQAVARRSNGVICYQRSWREGGVRCMGAAGVFDRLKTGIFSKHL